jgi:GTPase Era involved in 16S rRNA processing
MLINKNLSILKEMSCFSQNFGQKWIDDIVKQIIQYNNDLCDQHDISDDDQNIIEKNLVQYQIPINLSLDTPNLMNHVKNTIEETLELNSLKESFLSIEKDLNSKLNRPLKIAILGEFSAGKSRLINALLGEKKLLPEGKVPVTKMVTIVKYADKPMVILYNDHNEKINATIDDLKKHVDQRSKDANESIVKIELFYPLDILKNIEIIDTPGFNSANEIHDKEAKRLALEADAIIWVFSGHQSGGNSEAQSINWINQSQGKIIAVLNKIDTIDQKDISSQIERLKILFGSNLYHVIGVSAKWIEEGKKEGGKQEFENLLETLREETGKILKEKIINTKLKYIVKCILVQKKISEDDQKSLFNMIYEFNLSHQKSIKDATFLYEEISEFFKFSSKHHLLLLKKNEISLKLLLDKNEFGLGDFFYSPMHFLLPKKISLEALDKQINISKNHEIKKFFIIFYLSTKFDVFKDIFLKFNSYFFEMKKNIKKYDIRFKKNQDIQINQILYHLFFKIFNTLSGFIQYDEIKIEDSISYINQLLIKNYEIKVKSIQPLIQFSKLMYHTRFYRESLYHNDIQSKDLSRFDLVHYMIKYLEHKRKNNHKVFVNDIVLFDDFFSKRNMNRKHFFEALDILNDLKNKYYKDLNQSVFLCLYLILMNKSVLDKINYQDLFKYLNEIKIQKIDFQKNQDNFWISVIIPFLKLKIIHERTPNQIFFIYFWILEKRDIDPFTKVYIMKKMFDLSSELKYINSNFELTTNLLNSNFFTNQVLDATNLKKSFIQVTSASIDESHHQATAFINLTVLFNKNDDMIKQIVSHLNENNKLLYIFCNTYSFFKNIKLDIPLKIRIGFLMGSIPLIIIFSIFLFLAFLLFFFDKEIPDKELSKIQIPTSDDYRNGNDRDRTYREKNKQTDREYKKQQDIYDKNIDTENQTLPSNSQNKDNLEIPKEVFKFVSLKTTLIDKNESFQVTDMLRKFKVNKKFYISNQKISVLQYKQCVDEKKCLEPDAFSIHQDCNWGHPNRENQPINCIDWNQARQFAKWIGGDLPSEAQWISASNQLKADSDICVKLNPFTCDPTKETMWEWVLDEYHSSLDEPHIPMDEKAWCNDPNCISQSWKDRLHCRFENHKTTCFSNTSTTRVIDIGFRVIKIEND